MVDGIVCESCKSCQYKDVGKSDGTCRLCGNGSEGVLVHVGDKTCNNCKHSISDVPFACIGCWNHKHWEELTVVDQNGERVFYCDNVPYVGVDMGREKMDKKMDKKTDNKFADKIRMIAKSIYESADDIAGTTEGCIDISISFTIETNGVDANIPTYDVTRTHYPKRKLLEEYIFGKGERHD